MRGTNTKILRAALLLFNTNGVSKTSQRSIADHIAISPGNLTYHFQKRAEIVDALYEVLAERLTANLKSVTNYDLESLKEFVIANNKALFEYRFFLIDFVQICRQHPSIKKGYAKLITERNEVYKKMLDSFVKAKQMKPETLKEEYNHLLKRLEMIGDFWVLGASTTEETLKLKHAKEYALFQMEMLYPYLTASGQKSFKELF